MSNTINELVKIGPLKSSFGTEHLDKSFFSNTECKIRTEHIIENGSCRSASTGFQ